MHSSPYISDKNMTSTPNKMCKDICGLLSKSILYEVDRAKFDIKTCYQFINLVPRKEVNM